MMKVVNYASSNVAENLPSLLTDSLKHTNSYTSLYNAHNPDEIQDTYFYPSYDQAQISSEVSKRCL